MGLKKQTETALVYQILDYLAIRGVMAWRNNTGAFAGEYKGRKRFVRFGMPGASDILGVMPTGKFLCIEAKIGKNKPTEDQKRFLFDVARRGGLAILAYDLRDVIQAIEAL